MRFGVFAYTHICVYMMINGNEFRSAIASQLQSNIFRCICVVLVCRIQRFASNEAKNISQPPFLVDLKFIMIIIYSSACLQCIHGRFLDSIRSVQHAQLENHSAIQVDGSRFIRRFGRIFHFDIFKHVKYDCLSFYRVSENVAKINQIQFIALRNGSQHIQSFSNVRKERKKATTYCSVSNAFLNIISWFLSI